MDWIVPYKPHLDILWIIEAWGGEQFCVCDAQFLLVVGEATTTPGYRHTREY